MTRVTRRGLLAALGLGAPALILGGCDRLGASPTFRDVVLGTGEWLNYRAHRLIGAWWCSASTSPCGSVSRIGLSVWR